MASSCKGPINITFSVLRLSMREFKFQNLTSAGYPPPPSFKLKCVTVISFELPIQYFPLLVTQVSPSPELLYVGYIMTSQNIVQAPV
jgi:hypothetical protein